MTCIHWSHRERRRAGRARRRPQLRRALDHHRADDRPQRPQLGARSTRRRASPVVGGAALNRRLSRRDRSQPVPPARRHLPRRRHRWPRPRRRHRLQHALGRPHLRPPDGVAHRARLRRGRRVDRHQPARPVLGLPGRRRAATSASTRRSRSSWSRRRSTVTYFRYDFRGADDAGAMLAAFHASSDGARRPQRQLRMAQASPVGSGGPREAIDAFTRGQYVGPSDELRDLLAPCSPPPRRRSGRSRRCRSGTCSSRSGHRANPTPHSFGDLSRYAGDAAARRRRRRDGRPPRRLPVPHGDANGSVWSLGWVGGDVVDPFARTDTAYVAPRPADAAAPDTGVAERPPALGRRRAARLDGGRHRRDRPATPPTRATRTSPTARCPTRWSSTSPRTSIASIDVKTAYDPGNLFQSEQSIPTR